MATMGADWIFVDTNVLVAANVATHPRHAVALQRLKDLSAGGAHFWISRQVLREYLATLTRPQTFALPQPVNVLLAQVAYFQSKMQVADETASVTANLLALLQSVPLGGKQVHDANVVATMQTFGIPRLLTDNSSDFNRFVSLIAILTLVP
jgi:predicted nucleic acid-binding protein